MRKKNNDYYLKNQIKVNFFYSFFVLAFFIVFSTIVNGNLSNKNEFMKNAVKTEAVITKIEYESKTDEEIKSVEVKYIVNNKEYKGKLREISTNMYVGQVIDIFYDINNPQLFIQNDVFDNTLLKYFSYLILLVGIIQTIFSIKHLFIYLMTLNCKVVDATIERVIEKNQFFYKTFIIECKWTDESGMQYTFYSKSFKQPYFMNEFSKMDINKLEVRFKNKYLYIVLTEKIDKILMQ